MTRTELTAAVAEVTDTSKAQADQSVSATFEMIARALKAGEEVRIPGFGTFSVATRAASAGHNPRTGENIHIAASKQPKFKPATALKAGVNTATQGKARD